MKNVETLLGLINPTALPALRIAGALFIAINLLGGAWLWRHRGQLFGRDPEVEQDGEAVRHARVAVVLIPWLAVTTVLLLHWLGLWSN